jgi:hypothetical protein
VGGQPAPGRRAKLANEAGPARMHPPARTAVEFKPELGSSCCRAPRSFGSFMDLAPRPRCLLDRVEARPDVCQLRRQSSPIGCLLFSGWVRSFALVPPSAWWSLWGTSGEAPGSKGQNLTTKARRTLHLPGWMWDRCDRRAEFHKSILADNRGCDSGVRNRGVP